MTRNDRTPAPIFYGVLLFPNFPMMAFSALIEPLRAANLIAGRAIYRWGVVGLSGQPIMASNGYAITPSHLVADRPAADRIVVCSGGDADRIKAPAAIAWIRDRLRHGASLGAVADAAFFLAASGLLDGYRCTLHWTSQPAFAEAFPKVHLERSLFIIDRTRFTALGGIGSLDMQLAMIRQDIDIDLANAVADWFAHSPLRAPEERHRMPLSLRSGIGDRLVLACIADMEANCESPLPVADLAQRQNVSVDTLERAFRSALGETPGRYQRLLRLRRARDLLAHSGLSVREVALACGYTNPASFARVFRSVYGIAPREARNSV